MGYVRRLTPILALVLAYSCHNEPAAKDAELAEKAKALEAERDIAKAKSAYFTYAGSALQIAIVLSTAAILAVAMPLFWASSVVGVVGASLMAYVLSM